LAPSGLTNVGVSISTTSNLASELDELGGGLVDGGACLLQRPGPGGAAAVGDQVGVAPDHRDVLHRDAPCARS
jgi:hypothetical protein